MKAEEYDAAELGRLMIAAYDVNRSLADVELLDETDAEREALYDACYHAHKLANLLAKLAIAAERAYKEPDADHDDKAQPDAFGVSAPPGWFGNR